MAGENSTSYGTLFKLKSGETYTAYGELVTLKMPKIAGSTIDATNHSSGGKQVKLNSGLVTVDSGEAVFNFNSTDTMYAAVGSDVDAQVVYPNGVTYTFTCTITGFEISEADAQNQEVLTATVSFDPLTIPVKS